MKLTRHNGRSGKHGTYNPRHNDRRFDVENSEHIDAERARQNVYWDCYRGFTTHEFRENPEQPDFSFEEIERMYYYEHYGGHVEAQNARNEKTRHTERNRTVEDLLKNNKTCPEESIYQIGTLGESVPPDTLFSIVNEFYEEFERRFGSHIHMKDADAFYQRLISRMERWYLVDASQTEKERKRLEARNQEIDGMFLSLYTDKAKGILTEQRFMKLTAALEQEQEANQKRLHDLAVMQSRADVQESEVRTFIKEIRRYAAIEELDESILNRLISKILIGEVKKVDGQKVQEVRIVYNFVGEIPEIAA